MNEGTLLLGSLGLGLVGGIVGAVFVFLLELLQAAMKSLYRDFTRRCRSSTKVW